MIQSLFDFVFLFIIKFSVFFIAYNPNPCASPLSACLLLLSVSLHLIIFVYSGDPLSLGHLPLLGHCH